MATRRDPEVVDQSFLDAHLRDRAVAAVLIPKADGGMCLALRTDRYWQVGAGPDGQSLVAVDLLTVPPADRPLIAQSRPLGDLPVGRPLRAATLDDGGRGLHLTMADGSVLHLTASGDSVHAAVDGPESALVARYSSVVQLKAAVSDALGRSLGRLLGQSGFTSSPDRMTWTRQVEGGTQHLRYMLEPFPSMTRNHDGRIRTMVEIECPGLPQDDGEPVTLNWTSASTRVLTQPSSDAFAGPEQLEEVAGGLRQDATLLLRALNDASSATALASRVADGDPRFPPDAVLAVAVARWLAARDDQRAATFLDRTLSGPHRRRHTKLLADLRARFAPEVPLPDDDALEAGSGEAKDIPEPPKRPEFGGSDSSNAAERRPDGPASGQPAPDGPATEDERGAADPLEPAPHPSERSAGVTPVAPHADDPVADVLDSRASGMHWVVLDPDLVREALAERRRDLKVLSVGAETTSAAELSVHLLRQAHGATPRVAVPLERALSLLPATCAVVVDLDRALVDLSSREWEAVVDAVEAATSVPGTVDRQVLVLLCGSASTVRRRMARWWLDGSRARHTNGWSVWFMGPGRLALDDGDGWSTTIACTPTEERLTLHPDRFQPEDFLPEDGGVSMYERLVEGVRRLRPHMTVDRSPGPSALATLTVGGAKRRGRPDVLWVVGEGAQLAAALGSAATSSSGGVGAHSENPPAPTGRPVVMIDGRRCRTGRRFFQQLVQAAGLPEAFRPDWEALATLRHHLPDGTVLIIDRATLVLVDAPAPSWEKLLAVCDATVSEPHRGITVALCDTDAEALNKRRWVWHPVLEPDEPGELVAHHPVGRAVRQRPDGAWEYREQGRTMTFRLVHHQARLWIDGSTFVPLAPEGADPLTPTELSAAMSSAAAGVSVLHDGRPVLPLPAPRSGARSRPRPRRR